MNSGERIDYIRYPCQLTMMACSLLMVAPVLNPVDLIPDYRDSFPRRLCREELQFIREYYGPAPGVGVYRFTRAFPFQMLHTISSSAGWA